MTRQTTRALNHIALASIQRLSLQGLSYGVFNTHHSPSDGKCVHNNIFPIIGPIKR